MADKGRGGYPSDVTDEEWAFVLPYLLLCREGSPQRKHELRTVFNAVRYVARTGGQWRFLPHDLPPWYVVYQQMQQVRGLTMVPVNRVAEVFAGLKIEKVQSPEQAALVCDLLGCDALVVATVLRGGSEQSVALKIGRLPDPPADPALTGDVDTWVPALRLGVANTTADIRKTIKAVDEPGGLIVTQLRPTGPGALAGLKVGDLITHAAGKQLVDVADITRAAQPTPEAPLLLRVVRDGTPSFVAVTGEAELQFP